MSSDGRQIIQPDTDKTIDTVKPEPTEGERFMSKNGDWVVIQSQTEADTGKIELENQETFDTLFLEYDNNKWSCTVEINHETRKITHSDYKKLVNGIIKLLDNGKISLIENSYSNAMKLFKSFIFAEVKKVLENNHKQ